VSVPYAMNRTKLVPLLGPLAVLLFAAACGGGGGAAASSTVRGQAGVAQGVQAQQPGQSAPAAKLPSSGIAAAVPEGPRVQRTARITLEVAGGRFDTTLNDVIAIVDGAGGYISGSDAEAQSQGGGLRSGQVTFQVPADRFDAVWTDIRKRGTPQSISISGNDVSQQYVDLQARLRNAEAQRDAMLALMQQARTVADTIQVENQLGQVTSQIEELKGQIDFIDHSTTYATVSVTIHEATAGAPDTWGLQTAATQALHNLVGVLAFVVLGLGTLAPLLVAGLVLFVVGRSAWRRLGARGGVGGPLAE
jgi:hypothetical protein